MITLLENLKTHPPFTFLNKNEFDRMEKHAQIAYYPNETLLIDKDSIPLNLYIIIKGAVEVFDENEEPIDIYQTHDIFGGIEIIEGQPSAYSYIVTEELICFEIPKTVFLDICECNKYFKHYFFSSIIERMDMLKEKKEYASMSDLMIARLDKSILHKGVVVAPNMPIVEALHHMDEAGASCLLVENDEGYGIVTDADFRYYILHKEDKGLEKISQIQTYPAISANKGELLFNILLLMTEHSIKHLPVLDEENHVIGILELVDLLSFFSNQSHLITVQMERAKNLEDVVAAAKRLDVMISALHAKGVKSRYIAKLVSEINRKMYIKLFAMIIPHAWQDKCTLILLGSEGRASQILRTDQDNALVFEEGFMPEDVTSVTQQFIEVLDEIGFPRCEGEIMMINPKWCKPIEAYKEDIYDWIEAPNYEKFLDMAIFFDSTAVAGKVSLHTELIDYLFSKVEQTPSILMHFARAIETFESPLGLFSQFVHDKEHKNEIDIKKGALFALIHGVRALALEHQIRETNTTLRIKALNNSGFLSKEDATELMEALEVFHTLRLHSQLEKLAKGKPIDNYISVAKLGKLERDLLKEALKTVNKFKKIVSYHFHLSIVG
ncbi:putative nucleotidyltransferase substrate binding domain-containing protein [Sulfurovum sp. TSL1]|uniref:putative nucleotidyltransferase substrate binding domain-containing protein n=1 Tax=Sulfurovum sp. TSL1 TaxID=2826994 RepID=UPI001CC39E22|nr:putative nucleotidyltransferase substrate binding domain-containing protein [Sulfurovum sp. TSL1]GIT98246.1 cyclic nucleotide-binding protein [Sulfurovum sp. TSL1]